jgi:hypothetical protein
MIIGRIKNDTNNEKGIIHNRADIGISKYSSRDDDDNINIVYSAMNSH